MLNHLVFDSTLPNQMELIVGRSHKTTSLARDLGSEHTTARSNTMATEPRSCASYIHGDYYSMLRHMPPPSMSLVSLQRRVMQDQGHRPHGVVVGHRVATSSHSNQAGAGDIRGKRQRLIAIIDQALSALDDDDSSFTNGDSEEENIP